MADHLALLNRKLMDLSSRRTRRLIVQMPPRHGKSELCSKYLPAWYLGLFPEHRVVLASYEADFAASWGRKARDLIAEYGYKAFGVRGREGSSAVNRWDLQGHDGGMVTAGVRGGITGKGADLLIIDDYTKNAEEALSKTIRDKTWEWWQSTAYTRLQPNAVAVVIATRWHQDDLIGRLLEKTKSGGESWSVINLPAIAEENDLIGRQPGEALWPAHYPRERLEEIKANIRAYWWNALYQQRPVTEEGNLFKRQWFTIVPAGPAVADRVRYWDKAGTSGGGNYSAGLLMARTPDGMFYVEDLLMGQWSSHERNQIMIQTAVLDAQKYGNAVDIWVEQEPGSGGKESAEMTIQMLAGYPIHAETVQGSKEVRAEPLAAQAQAGNVRLVDKPWNENFIEIMASFPNGEIDDPVDAASGAFNHLVLGTRTFEEVVTWRAPVKIGEDW